MTNLTPTTPTVVFMMGGPGAGKSYTRKQVFPTLHVVDSDSWKERHPDYDPANPSAVHEWSKVQMTREFYGLLGSADRSFVVDGTGSNAEKMAQQMTEARNAGFRVMLVYVTAPLATALDRNRNRERVVPEHIVREKHATVETSFQMVKGYADEFHKIDNG